MAVSKRAFVPLIFAPVVFLATWVLYYYPAFPVWAPAMLRAQLGLVDHTNTDPTTQPVHNANQPAHEATANPMKFLIKHIVHAPTNKTRPVRRLDITPSYVAKHADAFKAQMALFAAADLSNLESVYHEFDWPDLYAHENPMTIELPIRAQATPNRVQLLAERMTPGFVESYLAFARKNPRQARSVALEWAETDVVVPDMDDKDTVIGLALIASNAYVKFPKDDKDKENSDWRDVPHYDPDEDQDFGWEDIGVRGHVFVLDDNLTVVVGIKGTLGAGLPGGGNDETGGNDKTNDNLLFSCCCARVLYMWTTVCDCYDSTYTCNQDCLEDELQREDRYYAAVLEVYRNVTAMYPPDKYNYWLTGHLLGGALASLVGRTFGIPVVAYEAPGEMLAAQRLHLPQAPGLPEPLENIWHVGNTADPIYMGVCNGALSTCNLGGYAMETMCHTGKQCIYDTVNDLGWRVNLLNHRIHTVIDQILTVYNDTAPCLSQPPCRDCFNWKFVSRDDDEPDAPDLPNPLKPKKPGLRPRPTTTTQTSTKPTPTSSETSDPTSTVPQKCLERTWYGWCLRWGDDDEEVYRLA